jgi:cytoskeletal protein CcmA (bactofilin family)
MAESTSPKAEEFATVIGPDAQFKGELTFKGGVRIDGQFEGSITTDGKVFVSKSGHLKAEVKATSLALEGKLDGNLTASERVELRATGQMRGDIRTAKLLVVEGATISGKCEVGPDVKAKSEPAKSSQPQMRPVAAGAGK